MELLYTIKSRFPGLPNLLSTDQLNETAGFHLDSFELFYNL